MILRIDVSEAGVLKVVSQVETISDGVAATKLLSRLQPALRLLHESAQESSRSRDEEPMFVCGGCGARIPLNLTEEGAQ
jgi:hypothetical protein